MKPAPFEYRAPATLDEALDLLARYGPDARPLAGGQSLVPAMNFRLARPAVLVDLNRLEGLAGIDPAASGGIRLGAMARHRAVERSPLVASAAPLVAEAMPHIAHPPIRNRATVGGSLAHADPAAELPAVMVTLGARFRLRSQAAERWVAAEDFFVGLFATALGPGELLVEIEIPALPPATGFAFLEVARRHGDYALVGVAAAVDVGPGDHCRAARLTFLSVGEGPVRTPRAAAALAGERLGDAATRAAAELAAREEMDPPGDVHASPAYRRQLAAVLARRALSLAAARARPAG